MYHFDAENDGAIQSETSLPWDAGLRFHKAPGRRPFSNAEKALISEAVTPIRPVRRGRAIHSVEEADRVAELVWKAMRDDRIELAFQGVCDTANSDVILYHECLARLTDEDGTPVSPAKFIPALESIGLIHLFDRYVFRLVVALLDKHPNTTLGVNVSALSVGDNVLWAPTFIFLLSRPDIAHRLVVEITETAPVNIEDARAFARRLRETGCRIAIDDFGAGYSLENGMAAGHADIIKIDASWLAKVSQGICSPADFNSFIAFASGLAPCVIVEGVETNADYELARRARIEWVQGYWFGKPSRTFDFVGR